VLMGSTGSPGVARVFEAAGKRGAGGPNRPPVIFGLGAPPEHNYHMGDKKRRTEA